MRSEPCFRFRKKLTEIRRVAKDAALVNLYIPCDPGMLYRRVRNWTSHLKQKKAMELSWTEVKYLWALEHRNHYLGVMFLINGIFGKDEIQISRFPLPALSWNLSLLSIVTIRVKKS